MVSLTFTVADEQHSKAIQDALFTLNGGWSKSGEYAISQEYQHTDKKYLHVITSYLYDEFGEMTGGKYLELLWSNDLKTRDESTGNYLNAKQQRNFHNESNLYNHVTIENFKEHFNKISF